MTTQRGRDFERSPAPTRARFTVLVRRVASLGATKELAERIVADAIRRSGGGSARLGAAAAMVQTLVGRGRIRRGEEAVRALKDLLADLDTYIPAPFWRDEAGGLPGCVVLDGPANRGSGAAPPSRARLARLRARSRALLALLAGSSFTSDPERG